MKLLHAVDSAPVAAGPRLRWLTITRTYLAIVTAILVTLGGISCDQPPVTAPGPVAPAPGFLRLELIAPETIAPGESAQLRAHIVKFDNSVQDVTGLGQWTSSNPSVLEINSTGVAKATELGEAFIQVRYQSRGASARTFVLPPGTYRLNGTVTDNGIALAGISVGVIDGVGHGRSTTTSENGTYAVYGVRDRIRLQAKGPGYMNEIQEVDVAGHRTFDFQMRIAGPRTDVRGSYRLTIDRNLSPPSGCTGTDARLPDSRSYDATVYQDGSHLNVTLSDADFIVTRGRGNTFKGAIDGNDRVAFILGEQDLYYWEERVQDLVERISGAQHALVITGTVRAGLSSSRISGTLLGWFLWMEGGGPPFRVIPNSCYIYTTHRFEMVRR